MDLVFLGAARTVTGSKTLLEAHGQRLLVDCGLFQGLKELRLRNWTQPDWAPERIPNLLLTHAHIDHSGFLPRLLHHGFRGRILCTPATAELAALLLRDSAHLQEEDAEWLNRKGLSKHKPALPLYTAADAERVLRLFEVREYEAWFDVAPGIRARFRNAGHILGSAMVELEVQANGAIRRLLWSGDVGRYDMPLNPDPEPPPEVDYLIVESTYGDRTHPAEPPLAQLQPLLERMVASRSILLVPAFAIGRAQQLVYMAREAVASGALPAFPIYIDSPMAVDATAIYCKYPDEHSLAPQQLSGPECVLYGPDVHLCRTVEESKRLNGLDGPALLISSSGMLTGGRVLHHPRQRLPTRSARSHWWDTRPWARAAGRCRKAPNASRSTANGFRCGRTWRTWAACRGMRTGSSCCAGSNRCAGCRDAASSTTVRSTPRRRWRRSCTSGAGGTQWPPSPGSASRWSERRGPLRPVAAR